MTEKTTGERMTLDEFRRIAQDKDPQRMEAALTVAAGEIERLQGELASTREELRQLEAACIRACGEEFLRATQAKSQKQAYTPDELNRLYRP